MIHVRCIAALLLSLAVADAAAGTFVFAGDSSVPIDVITHPRGYDGSGGELVNSVCFNSAFLPDGVIAAEAEASILKAIRTWNRQRPAVANLGVSGGNNDVVDGFRHDFESTVLHEFGHCLGLGHPNLSSESGLDDPVRNATNARRGDNLVFNIERGADQLYGSADDGRADDQNMLWFDPTNNDPLSLPDIVDRSTVSRDVVGLPATHTFAANGDRSVLAALGYADTESVMQQGQSTGEVQRRLTAEELRTLRLAMAGLDGIAGTADDYTLRLEYGGQVQEDVCDINVRFGGGLGSCASSGSALSPGHYRLTSATVRLGSLIFWHFSTAENTESTILALVPATPVSGGTLTVNVAVTRLSPAMTGGPSGRFEVMLGTAVCSAMLSVADPQSSGSCSLTVTGSGSQLLRAEYLGDRGFDASSVETALSVAAAVPTVTITSHTPDPSTTDQPYVVTVTVTGSAGEPTPTGLVIIDDGSSGCTLILASGNGACAVEPSGAGSRTVSANYGGDDRYAAASASVLHTVLAGSRIFRNGFEGIGL